MCVGNLVLIQHLPEKSLGRANALLSRKGVRKTRDGGLSLREEQKFARMLMSGNLSALDAGPTLLVSYN